MDSTETWKQIATKRITVHPERCIGCAVCVKVCPFMVYEVKKGGKGKRSAVAVYPQDCFLCQSCQAQCPADAITIDW